MNELECQSFAQRKNQLFIDDMWMCIYIRMISGVPHFFFSKKNKKREFGSKQGKRKKENQEVSRKTFNQT
jgi:hypothetical protein